MTNPTRRKLLELASKAGFYSSVSGLALNLEAAEPTLKSAAMKRGKLIGMYTTAHELQAHPEVDQIIEREFDMLADGNDLKMDMLRPTPTTFDFSTGDWAVAWAKQHNMVVRGHCLVWHNALPKWFQSYANPGNAQQLMTNHITTVMKHYAGQIYAWDVVNEPIHNDSADGLRLKPWAQLIGFDYIGLAFKTAAAADPLAKLVINENTLEHDNPVCASRRTALLNLVTKLKQTQVPINAVGLQSHIVPRPPSQQPP
jgi:endo-1,4-beta-xylanase